MKKVLLLPVFVLLLVSSHRGQSVEAKSGDDAAAAEKNVIRADIQALEARLVRLGTPLALARAKAEIADALWWVEQERAKALLREAYELTFPEEGERKRLQGQPVGTLPLPSGDDRARNEIRNRILQIAGRDKEFVDQLARLGAKELGRHEEHFRYAALASKAIEGGDRGAAGRYILQSIEADPTLITAGFVILDLAAQDRAAADRIVIQYIERLRSVPPPATEESALRTYFILSGLVFPSPVSDRQRRRIPPAGAEATKAYLRYVLESIGGFERSGPGSAKRFRGVLVSVWQPLRLHAPELVGSFLELEQLSRRPGDSGSLPSSSGEEASKERYERRLRDALNSDQPDDAVINSAIGREDFAKARKLIDKLDAGPRQTHLTEVADAGEAISLARKGDVLGAESLAERLREVASILRVYPLVIDKCGAKKDQACVSNLVHRAMRQFKRADTAPPRLPAGLPASAAPSKGELDPTLLALGKLARAIVSVDETLAFEVLEEMVLVANNSDADAALGGTSLDGEVFKKLAAKNEPRVRQAAESLKNPLRQIVVLAAICQWKAEKWVESSAAASARGRAGR